MIVIKWHQKISTKIICILIITLLVISVTLGCFSFLSEKNIATREMDSQADQTFYRVKTRLDEYIGINKIWIIEKLIDIELESNSQLIGVVLQKNNNSLFAGRIKTANNSLIPYTEDDLHLEAAATYKREGQMGDGDNKVTIVLYFTGKSVVDRLIMFVLRSVLLTFILLLAMGVILYLSLHKMIMSPIKILNNVVEMVIDQDFDTMAPVMAEDEIGKLANSFNQMTVNLRSNIYEVQMVNENLEEMVKARTEELDKANKQLTKRNQRMKLDLNMAKKVQMSIIPRHFPTLGMLDVYGSYVPMDDIGGDFYDVFKISDTKVAFVIADVCGHGIPSALITSMAKVSFANNSKEHRHTGEILKAVNDELYTNLGESGYYLTAFYCILDKTTRKIEYSSAGHPDIFILRENEKPLALESNSVFLGFFEDPSYSSAFQYLQKGDRLVLYTDGLTEAKSDSDVFYESIFYESLTLKRDLSPKEYVDSQIEAVKGFCGNTIYKDDITLLVIDFIMDDYEVHIGLDTTYEYIDTRGVTSPSKLNFINLNNTFVTALEKIEIADYDRALKLLLQLENSFYKRQDNFNVLKLLGYIYYKLEEYTNAITFWEKAISLNSNAEELVVNLGRLCEKLGDKPGK